MVLLTRYLRVGAHSDHREKDARLEVPPKYDTARMSMQALDLTGMPRRRCCLVAAAVTSRDSAVPVELAREICANTCANYRHHHRIIIGAMKSRHSSPSCSGTRNMVCASTCASTCAICRHHRIIIGVIASDSDSDSAVSPSCWFGQYHITCARALSNCQHCSIGEIAT